MKLEKELGHNPYKMGVVAGADVHSGYQGNEEFGLERRPRHSSTTRRKSAWTRSLV